MINGGFFLGVILAEQYKLPPSTAIVISLAASQISRGSTAKGLVLAAALAQQQVARPTIAAGPPSGNVGHPPSQALLPAPANVQAEVSDTGGFGSPNDVAHVAVSWSDVEGSAGYEVLRTHVHRSSHVAAASVRLTSETSLLDDLPEGAHAHNYKYQVRALDAALTPGIPSKEVTPRSIDEE